MKAVSSRTTIPILTGIKVVATEEGVTLTGSDADISIESFIPVEEDGKEIVEVKQSGSIVLQAKYFSEIVKIAERNCRNFCRKSFNDKNNFWEIRI